MRKIEDICVFYRKMPTYNPQGVQKVVGAKVRQKKAPKGENVYNMNTLLKEYTPRFKNYPKNVLEFNCERGYHPTQKPVALLEYLVKTYTNEGDTVLDNCMGSGSTGVAVQRVGGRHFIGIEQSKEYFAVAQQRINELNNYA